MDRYIQHSLGYALVLCLLLFAATVISRVHRVLTSPLSRLPGPEISKWTNLRFQYAVLKGKRVKYVHTLHEVYGPIVRTSPNEVSLVDVSAARTVYKIGGNFYKSKFYHAFTGDTVEKALFSMTDPHQHARHRQLTASAFSEKSIKQLEPMILKNVSLAMIKMKDEMIRNGFCDIFKWFTFMTTDVLGEASFGDSFRMLETGKKNQYIEDLEIVANVGVIRAEFPTLVRLLRHIPFGFSQKIGNCTNRLLTAGIESVNRYWKQLKVDPENIKHTLLTKEYAMVENGTLTAAQLNRDATGYIIAGTDTTAVTATYIVWLLASHPRIQEALVREVLALPREFTGEDLMSVRLLDNVINETLRLYGVVSQGLPRIVPEGGVGFCNHFIPQGTIVGVQSYTMHRDPRVWENPDSFNPSRWNDVTKDMKEDFMPWGGGSRICLGMHLAKFELRHAIASFLRAFPEGVQLSTAENFSDRDMDQLFWFLGAPRGKRCLVEPRDQSVRT